MYDTDEEQIEALKSWWQKYGNTLISAIILFLVAYFGINWYQGKQLSQREAASDVYQQILDLTDNAGQISDGDREQAVTLIAQLKTDWSDSTYAVYAALQSAALAVEKNDLNTAASELRWALEHSDEEQLSNTIQLRLARVLNAQGDTDGAMAMLTVTEGLQSVGYNELKGDILLAQGDVAGARSAFQAAMDTARVNGLNRPVLEMKLDDLAVAE